MRILSATLLSVLLAMSCQSALAWTRPGHMVSAAIAADELLEKHRRLVDRIMQIMSQHPDRGPFEVAVDRSTDVERTRRIFMEMARWPDDIRGSALDHPTWHYAARPLLDSRHPPAVKPRDAIMGSAIEAFALNVSVAADPRAPAPERAVALCWIFHLVGDIHQPLHTADLYSSAYPEGDRGGGRQYVLDPQTQQPVTLHWYWDDSVHRSGEAATVLARARELEMKLPRDKFSELKTGNEMAVDFSAWARESYALARPHVYRDDLSTSPVDKNAPALSAAYVADSTAVSEQRLTLAGYRLADLLVSMFPE
jgi:hypothetical protein